MLKNQIRRQLHERTAQKYKTLLYNLQKFKPGKMDFDSIDMQFQKDYIFWRYEYTKAESQNTINKDFGSIKNILKLSFKEGLHKNTIFMKMIFIKTAKTSIFALNESEVNRLYSFDFSDNPRLNGFGIGF
ncbi:MAG: phage integrase SAM-like domain-containing protein [Saprospiraceae bacterium]|nr:phage integrase SAM-like domain-containing protein [Saprospiraceae bacterium]